MASATGRNWWGVVPTGQLDSNADNMADGSTSYMQVGIDWFYENVSRTQFTIAPRIYRWDRYDTNNSGGYWYEVLNPDPNNGNTAKTWGPLYWGSGSGTREIDSFGTRTYTKGTSPITVTYRLSWYNTGTAYGGYYHGVSDGSHDWTFVIPASRCIVRYNSNGGSGSMATSTAYYSEPFMTRKNAFTKTGYTFNGWTDKYGGSWKLTSDGMYESGKYWNWWYKDGDLTLTAVWKANALTFPNQTKSSSYSKSAQTFTISAPTGGTGSYTYALDTSKTNSSALSVSSSGVLTLKAGTVPGKYTAYIKATDSGSKVTATKSVTWTVSKANPTVTVTTYISDKYAGSAVNLSTATASNCTYTLGYSKTSSTDSSTVTWLAANTSITSSTSGIAKDTTYYIWYKATGATNYNNIAATYKGTAKYAYQTYTISFNANGHGTAPSSLTKTYGTNLTLPKKIADTSITEDEFTLTFIANGENSNPGNLISTKTTTYVQQSWNTAADGSGTNYSLSGSYAANSATTLYAIWSSSSVSNPVTMPAAITKNDSVGTNVPVAGKYVRFYDGSTIKKNKTIMVDKVTSHTFGAWRIQKNSGNLQVITTVNAATEYIVPSSGLGYAANFSTSDVYTKFYPIEDIEHPTKEGYIFDGWYTASEGGTKVDFPYTPTSTDEVRVYAHWRLARNKNKIFFYDSEGVKRYAYAYFYDENGVKHDVAMSFFDSSGANYNLKTTLS